MTLSELICLNRRISDALKTEIDSTSLAAIFTYFLYSFDLRVSVTPALLRLFDEIQWAGRMETTAKDDSVIRIRAARGHMLL